MIYTHVLKWPKLAVRSCLARLAGSEWAANEKALAVPVLPGLVFPGTGAFLVAQERSSAQT